MTVFLPLFFFLEEKAEKQQIAPKYDVSLLQKRYGGPVPERYLSFAFAAGFGVCSPALHPCFFPFSVSARADR